MTVADEQAKVYARLRAAATELKYTFETAPIPAHERAELMAAVDDGVIADIEHYAAKAADFWRQCAQAAE